MPSLFITADTISVRVHSERLVLLRRDSADHRDGAIEEINVPFHELDRIVICGCPVVTMPVFHKLMSRNIPVVFLSSHGRWLGGLESGRGIHSARRIRQYETASDLSVRMRMAVPLIQAKIRNSRRVLQRLAATRNESRDSVQLRVMSSLRQLEREAGSGLLSLDQLRGVEGMAAVCYFVSAQPAPW